MLLYIMTKFKVGDTISYGSSIYKVVDIVSSGYILTTGSDSPKVTEAIACGFIDRNCRLHTPLDEVLE